MSPSQFLTGWLALTAALFAGARADAAFHLWHVKEVFSNADGSVQFIELFNSNSGERAVGGQTLRANSDGVIKNFVIPSALPTMPPTTNTHFLVATPGFGSLPGAVTPDYTLPDPSVFGLFFNPSADNITITFLGSNDSMAFTGALLPDDGFNGLTDMGASGFPPGTPNIQVQPNTPTRFANVAGQIDLRPPALTGDHNEDGFVDAADYVAWRKTPDAFGGDPAGYEAFTEHFGETPAGSSGGPIPEPATVILSLAACIALSAAVWRVRSSRRS